MTRKQELSGEQRSHRRSGLAGFLGHWQVAFGVLPWFGTVCFLINDGITSILGTQRVTLYGGHYWDIRIGMFDHRAGDLIIGLTLLGTCGLVALAIGIGFRVTGRDAFVVYHTAGTIMLAGLLIWGTTSLGWTLTWFIVHMFGSGLLASSWNLYRIDALRAAPRGEREGGDRDNKWAKLLGMAYSEPILAQAEITDSAITVPVEHDGGETLQTLQSSLPRIEAALGVVPGRSRAVAGKTANRSYLTVVTRDFLTTKWREWPGLSHPGGSFVDPIRTAYYDTGTDEYFMFAPELKGSLLVGRASKRRGRTSIGRQGTTGSGKSGDSNNEQAEIASRRDAVIVCIDVDKFSQNLGWLTDMMLMAGDTTPKANAIQRAVKRLAKVRQARMAKYGFREWGPEAYSHPQCRTPALYLFYDEADSVLGALGTWIAAKGLAAGIFLSATLPSADHESLPPRLRRSVGAWKCFGTGDRYSHTFVLDQGTIDATNAKPSEWAAQFPGAHLLDAAPGIDKRLYPITARSYASEHDALRAELLEAREHFTPATLHPEDEEALGDALTIASPSLLPARDAMPIAPEDLAAVRENVERETITIRPVQQQVKREEPIASATSASASDDEYEYEMDRSEEAALADGDESVDAINALREKIKARRRNPTDASKDLSDEDRRDLFAQDPHAGERQSFGPKVTLDDTMEQVGPESAREEFDRVLIEMAREARTEITSKEIVERCTRWNGPAISKRMTALCEGEAVSPPGVTISRVIEDGKVKRGRFNVVWEAHDTGEFVHAG